MNFDSYFCVYFFQGSTVVIMIDGSVKQSLEVLNIKSSCFQKLQLGQHQALAHINTIFLEAQTDGKKSPKKK